MNKIWNMINRIIGRKNSSTVKHLSGNDKIITDKVEIADALGEKLAFKVIPGEAGFRTACLKI